MDSSPGLLLSSGKAYLSRREPDGQAFRPVVVPCLRSTLVAIPNVRATRSRKGTAIRFAGGGF
ncbi:hypothetical protein FRAHR75_110043 [Frankia sp. Hr75.2]|nr:hypothetical protein FRAHR75_110043 [Frankia sp. Hr75.2]SQD98191.1 hypothetical protein FMEAI12_4560002 [Parafrankia sp. Ea1.12]